MFYDIIKELCKENNISISKLCSEINISSGAIDKWKKGAIPNGETLIKIGNRFNVSTDYLLERTNNPKINI